MKKIITLISIVFTYSTFAQTTIQNGDFELWENIGSDKEEPTFFNSNKTGTDWATSGPQTCFRDASVFHAGTYSVRIETKTFVFAVVNGSITTGIINAPTTSKEDGYVGTIKNTDLSDIRRMDFVGRPDSLVGWYQYTQGGKDEIGKVKAILHTGNYYDPEAASAYHPDSSINKIGEAEFLTPASDIATWTRFAVAFTYVSSNNPSYIMLNITSSNDQLTSTGGSKLWLDDLAVVYNSAGVSENRLSENRANVSVHNKIISIDFIYATQKKRTLLIYDVTGKLISIEQLSKSEKTSIDFSRLNSGLYFYQLCGEDIQESGKLIL